MIHPFGRANGFTLIEVAVALAVGGMAVAAAAALFTGLGRRADAIALAATRVDRDANAERLVRALLANVDFTADSRAPVLAGDERSVRFRAWCDLPEGWLGRCAVRLFFHERGGGLALWLELSGAESQLIEMRRPVSTGRLLYLVDAGHGGKWEDTWGRVVAPLALAVIVDNDTLIVPVWGNG